MEARQSSSSEMTSIEQLLIEDPVQAVQDFYMDATKGKDDSIDMVKLMDVVNKESENAFEGMVKKLLSKPDIMKTVPSVNKCIAVPELREMHHKLVRFDCVITDMYGEDLYVPVLKGATAKPLICKYFSELNKEQAEEYLSDVPDNGMPGGGMA